MDAGTLGVVELGGGVDAVQHGQGPPHCAGASSDSSTTEHHATSLVKSAELWIRMGPHQYADPAPGGKNLKKNTEKLEAKKIKTEKCRKLVPVLNTNCNFIFKNK